jgi:DeoR family fructose operon transcriptional repressor
MQAMVAAARRSVVVTDSTKVGHTHLHRFAALADIDLVLTDSGLDDETASEIELAGPEVYRA